jgi:hypothetical protein
MKKITESELRDRSAKLREYIAAVENQQTEGVLGNAAKWVGGALGLGGAAAGGAALQNQANAAAAPAAKPAAKSDPAVLKQQQDLIAKGAKIKADGIMGPATQAAIKQYGGAQPAPAAAPTGTTTPAAPAGDAAKNPVGTTNAATAIPTGGLENPANQAKPTATPAAPATTPAAPAAPAAAPAPGMTAVGDDEGNTTITRPDGSTMVVGADGKQYMPGSNPNLPQNKGMLNTIKNAATGKGDFQKPTGFIPPAPAAAPAAFDPTGKTPAEIQDARNKGLIDESVGFQNDELSRIISLVHHR